MNKTIHDLEPKSLWKNFSDLNAVPRPSKKEERVIAFMMDFGKSLELETFTDEVGNVIIRKPATEGMKDRKSVVLQSHLDMVHQKNADTVFDFDTQGIEMYIDGDWVKANGTTLGADNGIGVATIMALLESTDIPHPDLEALFTIDEETGMTGAMGLKGDVLKGEILLNLDTEEDDEIDIGCAGGIDVNAEREYNEKDIPSSLIGYKITVDGLKGGHSGIEIHKGLGNANKIMNRVLFCASSEFAVRIAEIDGGGLRNAIPRESVAHIAVAKSQADEFENSFAKLAATIKNELEIMEPGLAIRCEKGSLPNKIMGLGSQEKFIKAVYAAHNGVYAMSASIPDLVETSNNIARVFVKDGKIKVGCLTRSSVDSAKIDLANTLKSAFELAGFEVVFGGNYPGWNPNPDSEILEVLKSKYQQLFSEKPKVVACHAGLECGILGQNYRDMDMISFGPTIKGAHSPDERVRISSVQKFWKFVLVILEDIPKK
ncbi:aminoacyl-histidine dipeptidase [Maribacter halichondriae]|uniref:aminoacyl-histidine dipeptidase n=1 Tax=Maribacter halichondriae TaxID=2980554 RepID=UPI00235830E3|nr:aminoacyl-histidine dipeptidase [Maribacter sp. Hal144]